MEVAWAMAANHGGGPFDAEGVDFGGEVTAKKVYSSFFRKVRKKDLGNLEIQEEIRPKG